MKMTREEFKRRWELNDRGDGISFNDIAECARAWGVCSTPRIRPMEQIRYQVLLAAKTVDAEEFNPETPDYETT